MLRGKFIALNDYMSKKFLNQLSKLCLKKQENKSKLNLK